MRILIINSTIQGGGAARSATLLHEGLVRSGISSHIFCQQSDFNNEYISSLYHSNNIGKWITSLDRLPIKLLGIRRPKLPFSLNWFPNNIVNHINRLKPDIINLHWINSGLLPIRSLLSIKCPIVWTLHDSWPFTGGCHIPGNCDRFRLRCGYCPQLQSKRQHDLSHFIHSQKSKVYPKLPLTIVAPSNWIADCSRHSSLLKNKRINVIPNGVDLSVFKPHIKSEAKSVLGIELRKPLVLYGAFAATRDKNKGFDLLIDALGILNESGIEYELAIFGTNSLPTDFNLNCKVHLLGNIYDPNILALAYSAADVTIVPSRSENLPYTVIESLACGTPVVAFQIGGIPDIICSDHLGLLAKPYDCHEMAQCIAKLLKRKEADVIINSKQILNTVEDNYSVDTQVKQYLDLFSELLRNKDTNV